MRNMAKKLLMLGLSITLSVGLVGCSDKPPKYDGEKAKVYGEKLGNYYGDKLKDVGAKNIRKYIGESKKVVNSLKQNVQTLSDTQLVENVDKTIEQLIDLSDEYLNITEDDYKFFVNPLKYYDLYDDYDDLTQAAIGDNGPQMWSGMTYAIGIAYGGQLYSPFNLNEILKGQDKNKYYYVLKNTKYKLFFNDAEFVKNYEAKKNIIDTAIKIAKQEKVYFDINIDGYGRLKDNSREINELLNKKKFKVINNTDVLGQTYDKTIFEFAKMVKSKSKDDFKQKYKYIQWAKRDIANNKKYLAQKENYLKRYPNSKSAKDDVIKYKNETKQYEQKLKDVEEQFDKLYQTDINNLENQIKKLNQLTKNRKVAQEHLHHNMKVFAKTYKKLLQQGYKDYTISKYLTNGNRSWPCKNDILSFDENKHIELGSCNTVFSDYIDNMNKVLNGK